MTPTPFEISAEVERQGWQRCPASTDDHPWYILEREGKVVANLPAALLRDRIIADLTTKPQRR